MNYAKEIKTRLIWLIIGLMLSLGTAQVIKRFEGTLEQNLVLASFIPLIVYMSDAVGTQMEAIIIRELNSKRNFSFKRFIKNQVVIVLTVAVLIGIIASLFVAYIDKSSELGAVIGLSVFCGIVSSLITGTLLPYTFWRLHDDPAEASGPIATVIQDFMSVIIFFLIAGALLKA